ncbi:hypothetical protein YC2023_063896 [Brassica napus]
MIEAVDGESEDVSEKETVDINGFQVSASHVALVKKIFAEHPDIALGFKPKSQVVKTAYMNVLLGLINTLNEPSESHLEAELVISHSELSELEEVGFKIDWLKSKLENNFLERKKDDADGSRVQQLEERVKNLEDVSLEKKKADEAYGFRVQQFEESVKKLEMMVSVLKAKLDQEKAKSDSDDFLMDWFCNQFPRWGYSKRLPLSNLRKKSFWIITN